MPNCSTQVVAQDHINLFNCDFCIFKKKMFSILGNQPTWLIMTPILRLQGLDVKASTEDIRTFFTSVRIPDGGVYIVGGSLREAFIAFTTERDAQLAMCHSGKTLKGSKVTLSKSSMEELEKRLKLLLQKKPTSTKGFCRGHQISPASGLQPPKSTVLELSPAMRDPRVFKSPRSPHPITSNPQPSAVIDSGTAFLLGVCTVLGFQSSKKDASEPFLPWVDKICNTAISDEMRKPEQTENLKSGYARLFGLPQSATKELICHFFKGLEVQEVIVNVKLGVSSGCLVKFVSEKEACRALLFNHQLLKSNPIEVRGATEKMWTSALKQCEHALGVGESNGSMNNLPEEAITCKPKSGVLLPKKRRRVDSLEHDLPKKQRLGSQSTVASPLNREYWVLVRNLPNTMTKTEIKELLGCPNTAHKNVLHLLDQQGNRTDTSFVLFTRIEDSEYATNLTGCHVGSNVIQVSATTESMVKDMMAKALSRRAKCSKKRPHPDGGSPSAKGATSVALDPTALTCLYVRNMPADVTESQIKSLLFKYRLNRSKVKILTDGWGKNIGEAVVQFNSEKLAALAQRLHGQHFLGSQLLLTRINVKQMDILANV